MLWISKIIGLWILLVVFAIGNLFLRNVTPAEAEQEKGAIPYAIYQIKAITNTKILPDTFPILGSPGNEVHVTACQGEYDPATFVVHALQDIKGLLVTATDLHGNGSIIPASAVDIRVVKCWFQAGVLWNDNKQCLLTPELLLKDDRLVKVDLQDKKNYLRTSNLGDPEQYVLISGKDNKNLEDIQPHDADTLQPVDISAKRNKQFWITVHVPTNATPGDYRGTIKLSADGTPSAPIVLRVRVLPFSLEKPALTYSMYYRGKLTRNNFLVKNQPAITPDWKSDQQYYAEMVNLKSHGVDFPIICQSDEELVKKELEIRQKAGLPKGPLFATGLHPGTIKRPEEAAALKQKVDRWVRIAEAFGYGPVYAYGIDEGGEELIKLQQSAWDIVHQQGVKVFAAISSRFALKSAAYLDLANVSNLPDPKIAAKYHAYGHQVFNYGYPQSGAEEPDTYRRKYGLPLWQTGYDGAMDYAYQHAKEGHIWNDFNHPSSRPTVVAYPTVNGVIDTVQWEGFREGVDDVRYVTTLLKAIQRAKASKPQVAIDAQRWVDSLDLKNNLDEVRSKMIDWIIKLQ